MTRCSLSCQVPGFRVHRQGYKAAMSSNRTRNHGHSKIVSDPNRISSCGHEDQPNHCLINVGRLNP